MTNVTNGGMHTLAFHGMVFGPPPRKSHPHPIIEPMRSREASHNLAWHPKIKHSVETERMVLPKNEFGGMHILGKTMHSVSTDCLLL